MPKEINRTVWSSDQGDLRKQPSATQRIRCVPPGEQTVYLHRDSKRRGGKTVTLVKELVLSDEALTFPISCCKLPV